MQIFLNVFKRVESLLFAVSIGVTAGLFLGASLLSIVEVIYYFFFRACAKERKESIDENESVTQNILPFVL